MSKIFGAREWAHAANLLQAKEEDPSDNLPWGDAAVNSFNDEAADTNTPAEGNDDLLSRCRFHKSKDIVKPDFHFRAGAAEFCQGNGLTAISGKAKQGKSQFATVLAGILLSGHNFGTIERKGGGNCVAWIDTEQNNYNLNKNLERLYHLGGIPADTPTEEIGLHVFTALQIDENDRCKLLVEIIEKLCPDTIFIDGIGDFIEDFNNNVLSKKVAEWLLRLCDANNINIICVMHTNEGNDLMQGSFGRYLLKKCNDRFEVSKVTDHFNVKHLASRDLQMNDFNFFIDGNGILQPYDTDTLLISDESALQQVFEGVAGGMKYPELEKAYCKITGLTKRAAHTRLLDCMNVKHILTKNDEEGVFYYGDPF